jgi:hypothetical protein
MVSIFSWRKVHSRKFLNHFVADQIFFVAEQTNKPNSHGFVFENFPKCIDMLPLK